MGLPAELRVEIYEWLFIAEGQGTVIPGKWKSDEWDAGVKQYRDREIPPRKALPWRANYSSDSRDYSDPVVMYHGSKRHCRTIDAQKLPILSVNRQIRQEAIPVLFARRLAFPRLWDIRSRIPPALTHLPPLYRDCIKKVSIEIWSRNGGQNHYGNFIIPFLPLCQNLDTIELRFSLRFYKLIFGETTKGSNKYQVFTKLVKLLIYLLNLPVKDLKVTVGPAYKRGDGLLGYKDAMSNDVETEVESTEDTDSNEPAELPQEMKAKKAQFDKTYANIFIQAAKLREGILSLPTYTSKKVQAAQRAPVYQFYEMSMQEKMVQMMMDIETSLNFDSAKGEEGWGETLKLSVKELLEQKTKLVYEDWLVEKYRVPRNMVELRLAEHQREWKTVGFEDQMLLELRPGEEDA